MTFCPPILKYVRKNCLKKSYNEKEKLEYETLKFSDKLESIGNQKSGKVDFK